MLSVAPGRRDRARLRLTLLATLALALAVIAGLALTPGAMAQDGDDPLNEIRPAPPSIGADIPLTYFAPPPSTDEQSLIGPLQLMRSGEIDQRTGTITLPLYEGRTSGGRKIWYVITDTSDREEARSLGILFSAKLKYTDVDLSVRRARLVRGGQLVFAGGTVDFSPERRVEPGTGTDAFPPSVAQPGSVGTRNYSPLVRVVNEANTIYNAPIVAGDVDADRLNAFCDGNVDHSVVHDAVTAICPREQTVTLKATAGFSFARPILYLSTDANQPDVAALEGVTFAPGLREQTVGRDDSAFSAVERIFIATNGPTGKGNPQRQGLNSALRDGGGPLNVFGGIPTVANDYSPLWDANIYSWTKEAIDKDYRSRNFEEFRILGLARDGHITGPNGTRFGSSGVIINCPPIFRFL